MDKKTIIVAGDGHSSRANVEALVEDYLYANNKQEIVFAIAYDTKPSQGQIFAAQLAKDKGKKIAVFCKPGASLEGITTATVLEWEDPYYNACAHMRGTEIVGFVLADDEDEKTNKILAVLSEFKIPSYDLTEGLNLIKFNSDAVLQEEPIFPEAELLEDIIQEETEEEYEDDELDYEEEEDMEEEELSSDVYVGLQSLIKVIAKEVAAEVVKAMAENTPKKVTRGSKK